MGFGSYNDFQLDRRLRDSFAIDWNANKSWKTNLLGWNRLLCNVNEQFGCGREPLVTHIGVLESLKMRKAFMVLTLDAVCLDSWVFAFADAKDAEQLKSLVIAALESLQPLLHALSDC